MQPNNLLIKVLHAVRELFRLFGIMEIPIKGQNVSAILTGKRICR